MTTVSERGGGASDDCTRTPEHPTTPARRPTLDRAADEVAYLCFGSAYTKKHPFRLRILGLPTRTLVVNGTYLRRPRFAICGKEKNAADEETDHTLGQRQIESAQKECANVELGWPRYGRHLCSQFIPDLLAKFHRYGFHQPLCQREYCLCKRVTEMASVANALQTLKSQRQKQ